MSSSEIQDSASSSDLAVPLFPPSSGFLHGRRILMYNPLSGFWSCNTFSKHPGLAGFASPIVYLMGMIGYAASCPIRITILGITVIRLIATLCMGSCQPQGLLPALRERSIICLGALGETGSGLIGIFCPIIAYKMDESIQKNTTIHKWYSTFYLSRWIGNDFEPPHDIQKEVKEWVISNKKHFIQAKTNIAGYTQSGIEEENSDLLCMIVGLGVLYEIGSHNGKSLTTLFKTLIEHTASTVHLEEQGKKKQDLETNLQTIEKYWQAIQQSRLGFTLLILYEAIEVVLFHFLEENIEKSSSLDFNEGVNKKLKQTLLNGKVQIKVDEKSLSVNEAIKNIATELRKFYMNISTTNVEIFNQLYAIVFCEKSD